MGHPRPGGLPIGDRRAVVGQVLAIWLATLVAIRWVVGASASLGGWPGDLLLAAVPLLFMYVPVWMERASGRDPDRYPIMLPARTDRATWSAALRLNAVLIGLITVPWVVGYHLYQTRLFGFQWEGTLPPNPALLVAYHLFFAAIPEEIFYRGYLQSRLDEVFPTAWRLFGAQVGPGLLITSVIFAFGHSVVRFQWWHFAIVFPALVFGWMRARTGSVAAGALFHAWCNITVGLLDALYGVTPPS